MAGEQTLDDLAPDEGQELELLDDLPAEEETDEQEESEESTEEESSEETTDEATDENEGLTPFQIAVKQAAEAGDEDAQAYIDQMTAEEQAEPGKPAEVAEVVDIEPMREFSYRFDSLEQQHDTHMNQVASRRDDLYEQGMTLRAQIQSAKTRAATAGRNGDAGEAAAWDAHARQLNEQYQQIAQQHEKAKRDFGELDQVKSVSKAIRDKIDKIPEFQSNPQLAYDLFWSGEISGTTTLSEALKIFRSKNPSTTRRGGKQKVDPKKIAQWKKMNAVKVKSGGGEKAKGGKPAAKGKGQAGKFASARSREWAAKYERGNK